MNNEDVRIWKEIHLKTLSWNSSSDTEENHENSHDSDKSIGNLNLEPFKYRPKKLTLRQVFGLKSNLNQTSTEYSFVCTLQRPNGQ
jgi:hypothetical protein